jgi:uncharacterized spore protein YtfJ
MLLNDLVKGLLGELGKITKSEVVVGNVRDAGQAKVLPLCRVSIGFGTAGADAGGKHERTESKRNAGLEGGGAGGALVVEPKAFVVVGPDGVPQMYALHRGKSAVKRRGLEVSQLEPTEASPKKLAGK